MLSPRWVWPPDKWERLSTVASLVGDAASVLDVGGRAGELQRLLPRSRVTTLNLEPPADVVVSPGPLPYPDASFDVVTSTDVLEHMPEEDRAAHVGELVRVARHRLVACFPAGSPRKLASERALADRLDRDLDVRFEFLDEHLAFGLPRATDVVGYVRAAEPGARTTVRYHDGITERDGVLVDAMRFRRRGNPVAAARVLRAWVRRRTPELTDQEGPDNHRAFLVAELG